jgi:hypothetical protein
MAGRLRAAGLGALCLLAGCTLPLAGRGAPGDDGASAAADDFDAASSSADATVGDDAAPSEPGPHPDAGDPGAPVSDGGPPTGSTNNPCAKSAAGCVAVPAGWTLVAFSPSQASSCPTGFDATPSQDVVEGPTPASACTCGACSVSQPPSCAAGSIAVNYDSTTVGACDKKANPSPLGNSPAGSCGTDLFVGDYSSYVIEYVAPPPSGGACTAHGVPTTSAVMYASRDRVCLPDSAKAASCDGGTCHPALSSPYAACIAAPGDVACPAGPLSVQHKVGTSASVSCGDCSCSVTAACSGTLTLYTDTGCTKGPYAISTGVCVGISSAATYRAYEYTAGSPTNIACQAGAPSAAQSVTLAGPQTICCAQ